MKRRTTDTGPDHAEPSAPPAPPKRSAPDHECDGPACYVCQDRRDERALAEAFKEHRRQDPHCTCPDCIQATAGPAPEPGTIGRLPENETDRRPFHLLKPGDRIIVSYGIITVGRLEPLPDGRVTVHPQEQQSPITYHASNWPELAAPACPVCHQTTTDPRHAHPHDYVGSLEDFAARKPCLACRRVHSV